jgi:hypothetical protein
MTFIFDPSLVLYLPLYELDANLFMSGDAYGRVCTVTGAVWQPDGRYFDGNDDVISVPNPSLGIATHGLTVIAVIKPGRVEGWQNIIDIRAADDSGEFGLLLYTTYIRFYLLRNIAATYHGYQSSLTVSANTWYMIAATWPGGNTSAAPRIFVNNVEAAISDAGSSGVDGQPMDTTNALRLGLKITGGDRYQGITQEALIYRRVLTPLELNNIWMATKWRYQ